MVFLVLLGFFKLFFCVVVGEIIIDVVLFMCLFVERFFVVFVYL